MHRILVIRLYFLLDALHVSDSVRPSSGATYKVAPDDGLIQSEICRASNGK